MHSEGSLDNYLADQPCLVVDVHAAGDADTVRLTILGEVDALSAPRLQTAVLDALSGYRPGRIEMDFRGVPFLDSAGIRALVLSQSDAEAAGCRIVLVDTTPLVRRVLQISGLLDHFGLVDSP